MAGRDSNSRKKNSARQLVRIWVQLLAVFLLAGSLTTTIEAAPARSGSSESTVTPSQEENGQENPEENAPLPEDDPEEDVPAEDLEQNLVSEDPAATVCAPPKEKIFHVKEEDPLVISLAKAQTPKKGKIVTSKGKTFWRLKNGKRLKNSWVWYRGHTYWMNRNGYAVTGMHSYKGFFYCFDSAGRLIVKRLFTYKRKTFYACKTGSLVTGAWCKVKGYFRYFKTSGVMAVSTKIGSLKVDSEGKIDCDNGAKPVRTGVFRPSGKKQLLIIVGASRVVHMSRAVATDRNVVYIARSGKGFNWLKNQAIPKLRRYLKKYPKSKVVIQLGNNDLKKGTPDGRIDDYIQVYKNLIGKWPKAKFYFMDILPPGDDSQPDRIKAAKDFNSMLALVFPGNYIGGWNYMMNNGFRCSYNLSHYSDNSSRDIFNFVLRKIR